jgi:hypothetical protein
MSAGLTYVVVAYSPFVDTTAVVGPFGSYEWALAASQDLVGKGYNTEICPLSTVADVVPSSARDGGE